MAKNYLLRFLNRPDVVSKDSFTVAYVIEKTTKRIVLYLDVVADLLKKAHQTCCFVGECEDKENPGEPCALIYIDPYIFMQEVYNDKANGEVMLMHELAHFVMNHYKNVPDDYSKIRKESENVMLQEYEADEFAVRECGIYRFTRFIDKMAETRKIVDSGISLEKALNEFQQRKKHAIEYANRINH